MNNSTQVSALLPLSWNPEQFPEYDEILTNRCDSLLAKLLELPPEGKLAFVLDPRAIHREMYSGLTAPAQDIVRGTYRGEPGTPLETHYVQAILQTENGVLQGFQCPQKVLGDMAGYYAKITNKFFSDISTYYIDKAVREAVIIFYTFGRIHPFANGNGHIQRLIFAVCLSESPMVELLKTWTIHARPYGYEYAEALEQPEIKQSIDLLAEMFRSHVREKTGES